MLFLLKRPVKAEEGALKEIKAQIAAAEDDAAKQKEACEKEIAWIKGQLAALKNEKAAELDTCNKQIAVAQTRLKEAEAAVKAAQQRHNDLKRLLKAVGKMVEGIAKCLIL